MKLSVSALLLGIVTGFVFGWARMTDPETFHDMLALRSPTIYLLMASAVAVAFAGSRLLRGRPALLGGQRIDWSPTRPTRNHVLGSVIFGVGWGVSDACPGPVAAQLGTGRLLAFALAAGILAGVALEPALARVTARARRRRKQTVPAVGAADVL